MSIDALYSYLMNSTGLFLLAWTVALALACLVVFRHD